MLGGVDATYDKFKDITVVRSTPQAIHGTSFPAVTHISVQAIYTCRGNGDCLPDSVALAFHSGSESWRFLKGSREVHLIVDGERIALGEMTYDGDVRGLGGVYEILAKDVPRDVFEKIARGRQVEAKIGHIQTKFSDQAQTMLRKVAERWAPTMTTTTSASAASK